MKNKLEGTTQSFNEDIAQGYPSIDKEIIATIDQLDADINKMTAGLFA